MPMAEIASDSSFVVFYEVEVLSSTAAQVRSLLSVCSELKYDSDSLLSSSI